MSLKMARKEACIRSARLHQSVENHRDRGTNSLGGWAAIPCRAVTEGVLGCWDGLPAFLRLALCGPW